MNRRAAIAAVVLAFALIASSAGADVTVIGRYHLANGDTLTRASYYTQSKVRTTLPNGDEIIYDDKTKRVALIDHSDRRFWEGPKSAADSIALKIRSARMKAAAAKITPEQRDQVNRLYSAVSDSVHVIRTEKTRKIANYGCRLWVLSAGSLLTHERWVARALAMPDFSQEVEKVVLATIADPLGSGLMKLVLATRAAAPEDAEHATSAPANQIEGLTLAGRIRFKTMRNQGEFSWEAVSTSSEKIPPAAWQVPEGYTRWQPPSTE